MLYAAFVTAMLALTACSTNGQRIDRIAGSAGLHKRIVTGLLHSHVVYEKRPAGLAPARRLLVFLEGDGLPWSASGLQPAEDPTSRNPLALRLMLQTNAAAIYLARPCYQDLVDEHCSPELWTSGRLSEAVVTSMVSAVDSELSRSGAPELVLIGYSGGGALAVLIAERLEHVAGVITLAANLDLTAWSNHHRYLPLVDSLNPAESQNAHPWPEFHFNGTKDAIVPVTTTDRYFQRFPEAKRFIVDGADHACCWEKEWPALLARVQKDLE